jgi:hypothetical protein
MKGCWFWPGVAVKSSGPLANGDIMCPFMYRLCG